MTLFKTSILGVYFAFVCHSQLSSTHDVWFSVLSLENNTFFVVVILVMNSSQLERLLILLANFPSLCVSNLC